MGGNGELAGLGRFHDRDGEGEHPGVVVGLDVVGVEGLAEEQLAGEGARGRSLTIISAPSAAMEGLSAFTARTFCSTVRSIEAGSTPGRSKWT